MIILSCHGYWSMRRQITNFKGSASYSNVIRHLDSSNAIDKIFTAFDVDFSTGLVEDGYFLVCTSCGGSSENNWVANFDGVIKGIYFNTTSLSGLINNADAFAGQIAGVFVEPVSSNAPYKALAGGFNFVQKVIGIIHLPDFS